MQYYDKEGNMFSISMDGYVFLRLKSTGKTWKIGHMNNKTGVYFKKAAYLFHKLNAFGFSTELITILNPKKIVILYNGTKYFIKRDKFDRFVEEHQDNYLHFKGMGFERQVFIPFEQFEELKPTGKGVNKNAAQNSGKTGNPYVNFADIEKGRTGK